MLVTTLFAAFTFASAPISAPTMAAWPASAAKSSGVTPSYHIQSSRKSRYCEGTCYNAIESFITKQAQHNNAGHHLVRCVHICFSGNQRIHNSGVTLYRRN